MLSTAKLTADPGFQGHEPAFDTRIDTGQESLSRESGSCRAKSFVYRRGSLTRTITALVFVRVSKVVRYTNDFGRPSCLINGSFRTKQPEPALRERLPASDSFAYRRSRNTRTTFSRIFVRVSRERHYTNDSPAWIEAPTGRRPLPSSGKPGNRAISRPGQKTRPFQT